MKNKREITIRVSEQEFAMLESHCQAVGRTKTDILREFIRSLDVANSNLTHQSAGMNE
jgi:negative regulator of replication initiation